jgi:hypothetical protein
MSTHLILINSKCLGVIHRILVFQHQVRSPTILKWNSLWDSLLVLLQSLTLDSCEKSEFISLSLQVRFTLLLFY